MIFFVFMSSEFLYFKFTGKDKIMMPKTVLICLILTISVLAADSGQAQSVMDDFNVDGPRTDLERTTITAPKFPLVRFSLMLRFPRRNMVVSRGWM